MSLEAGKRFYIPFVIPQTELLAPTSIELVAPDDGWIDELQVVVQTAVTTGGAVTVNVVTTPVAGLSVAIANGATKGTTASDTPTSGSATRRVLKGQRIQIVPSAAFDTAGALAGYLILSTTDKSPLAQY